MDKKPLLAKVHIAKKELGLDDETYRAILKRITGKDSAAKCKLWQLDNVLREMKNLGWKPKKTKKDFRPASDEMVAKIYALWRALHNAGAIDDPSQIALRAFVKRQIKKEAPEFLTIKEKIKVIEALKSWLRRVEKEKK